jgi:flagellar assembly protein FliH
VTTSDVAFTSWQPKILLNESTGSQPAPEEIRQQARNEGYADGYTEGLEAGKKTSLDHSNAKVAQLQSLIDALERPFKNIESEVSEYLLSLVSAICKSVLSRELSTDVGHIHTTLERALELLSGQRGTVNLSLHPDDASVVSDLWSDDFGEFNIIASPEITRGGCLIKRNDSVVDATIESQLRKIISELSLMPGPVNSSGEAADLLDSEQVDVISKRLGTWVNDDE